MCVSLAHWLFNLSLGVTLALLITSAFSPGWQKVWRTDTDPDKTIMYRGLIVQLCEFSNADFESAYGISNFAECSESMKDGREFALQTFEKITLLMMMIAVAICIATFVWSCIVTCGCCCEKCLVCPLVLACLLGAAFTIAAFAIYMGKYEDIKNDMARVTSTTDAYIKSAPFYSAYFAVLAAVGYIGATCIAVWMMCSSKTAIL